MSRSCNGSTTGATASANSLSTGDATETPTDSPIAKSARVGAANRRTSAFCHEWSALAAAPSANGTTTPEATAATNSTTEDAKATPTDSITPKSVRVDARGTGPSQPARRKYLTFHILANRIVKMNGNEHLSVSVIQLMEVILIKIIFKK